MEKQSDELKLPPRGTRDMLPFQMAIKEEAISKIKKQYKKHGAVEIDTPVFERREVLVGKYGEQQKLIFNLEEEGGVKLALRYDLTVPFSRFMATHNLNKIKRFHIGKVYRRDDPSIAQGRFREFYQCDFDIAGPSLPMLADAEALKVFCDVLVELDIDFKFKINDRRLLDAAIIGKAGCPPELFHAATSAIDKLDKNTWEEVARELKDKGLNEEMINEIQKFVGLKANGEKQVGEVLTAYFGHNEIIEQVQTLFGYLEAMDLSKYVELDTSMARGLDYYTGMIFEAVLQGKDAQYGIGSIGGGGRYDKLIGKFSNHDIPSTGGSIGIERIFSILEKRAKENETIVNPVSVFVGSVGAIDRKVVLQVANWLWEDNYTTEIFYEDIKTGEQLAYALSRGAQVMVLVGEEELKSNQLLVKDLKNKSQVSIALNKGAVMAEMQRLFL